MEITQAQKYEILEHELLNGAGLEEILKKCLEILMKSERKILNENYSDYSNGYRYRKIYGSGKLPFGVRSRRQRCNCAQSIFNGICQNLYAQKRNQPSAKI